MLVVDPPPLCELAPLALLLPPLCAPLGEPLFAPPWELPPLPLPPWKPSPRACNVPLRLVMGVNTVAGLPPWIS